MTDNLIVDEKRGKISAINYDKRIVWVKDDATVTYELKWQEKPEVIDDLMRKQKTGFRVKITVTKNLHDDVPQFWITDCVFDDSYKKGKGAYAQSPEEQKLVLLQSNVRSGAMVFAAMIETYKPKAQGDPQFDITTLYNMAMNVIVNRAIVDTEKLMAEAKKV